MSAPIFSATHRQMSALIFIAGYQARWGRTPSYDEIGAGLGLSQARSNVHRILGSLEERGYIRRARTQDGWALPRSIEILRAPPLPRSAAGDPLFFIPAECLVHHARQNNRAMRQASSGMGF